MDATAGIRRFGAASLDLAYVAAGRFDGFWEHGLQPWDVAAGIVLVREAGGMVTDLNGGDQMLANGQMLCANDTLHPQLLKLLKDARSLELDHGADAFARMHQLEGFVDPRQRQLVGDQGIDGDLAVHVPIDDARHFGAARARRRRPCLSTPGPSPAGTAGS